MTTNLKRDTFPNKGKENSLNLSNITTKQAKKTNRKCLDPSNVRTLLNNTPKKKPPPNIVLIFLSNSKKFVFPKTYI
jgi:hypothetical protein